MADGKAVGLELAVVIKQLLFLFHYLLFDYLWFLGSPGVLGESGQYLVPSGLHQTKAIPLPWCIPVLSGSWEPSNSKLSCDSAGNIPDSRSCRTVNTIYNSLSQGPSPHSRYVWKWNVSIVFMYYFWQWSSSSVFHHFTWNTELVPPQFWPFLPIALNSSVCLL